MRNLSRAVGSGSRASREPEQSLAGLLHLTAKLRSVGDDDRAGSDQLLHAIETEIIPRLLVAHAHPAASQPTPSAEPTAAEQERFLKLVLGSPKVPTRPFVEALLRRGVSRETLFLDLLP